MKKVLSTLVGASVLATASMGFSDNANALTLGSVACSTSNLSGSVACEGAFDGNDANQNLDGLFGMSGWTELFKVDSDSGVDEDLTVTGGGKNGGWSLTGLDTDGIMIVLKGGPSFSAYLLDGATSGTWNTDGLFKGNGSAGPGLSHFTVYEVPGEPVPEPLTILGAGAAISFGTAFKRKLDQAKKSDKQA